MTIKPLCDRCSKELTEFGALLFSPPEERTVKKFHICKECYDVLKKEMKSESDFVL